MPHRSSLRKKRKEMPLVPGRTAPVTAASSVVRWGGPWYRPSPTDFTANKTTKYYVMLGGASNYCADYFAQLRCRICTFFLVCQACANIARAYDSERYGALCTRQKNIYVVRFVDRLLHFATYTSLSV